MKCSACDKNECERNYENRHKCVGEKEDIECTCICQTPPLKARATAVVSYGAGALATGGGFALATAASSAALTFFAAPVIIGAGTSLIFKQVQKHWTGERMIAKETAKDVGIGAVLGAVTGPFGAGGSYFAEGATTLVRYGIKSLAGASAGAVSGAVVEGTRYYNGEEVSLESVKKSVLTGAAAGFVGGASSQFASSASNQVTSEISKAVTRVGTQTVAAAATDASIQYYQTGTVDPQQLAINATAQIASSAAAEAGSSMAQRTTAYNNKVNNKMIDKSNATPDEKAQMKNVLNDANANKNDIAGSKGKHGEHNLHNLERDRVGQVAGDIGPSGDGGKRGAGRVIMTEHKGNMVYVDHTMDHDYKGCNNSVTIQDPMSNMVRTELIQASLINDNDGFDGSGDFIDNQDNEKDQENENLLEHQEIQQNHDTDNQEIQQNQDNENKEHQDYHENSNVCSEKMPLIKQKFD